MLALWSDSHDTIDGLINKRIAKWRSFASGVKEFRSHDYLVAPLAIDYNKDGRLLATTGEAGMLTITDHHTDELHVFDLNTGDAMTDVQWGHNHRLLLPSADGYCYVYDAAEGGRIRSGPIASFDGGGEAVKCAKWGDGQVVAMAGRDGAIRLFDFRLANKSSLLNQPMLCISNAHKKTRQSGSMVSSLQFVPNQPHHVLSIGQPDYNVHLWDIRYTRCSSPATTIVNPTSRGKRTRAFVDICCSPDGADLYAVNSNNVIYKFCLANLELDRELTHSQLRTGSFYLRAQVSLDGRYLACGSAGDGSVWIFNTNTHCSNTIIRFKHDPYEGEHVECTGVSWRPLSDSLAAALDSGIVCFWGGDERAVPFRSGTIYGAVELQSEYKEGRNGNENVNSENFNQTVKHFTWASLSTPTSTYSSNNSFSRPLTPAVSDTPSLQQPAKKSRTILDYFPSSGRPSPIKKTDQ